MEEAAQRRTCDRWIHDLMDLSTGVDFFYLLKLICEGLGKEFNIFSELEEDEDNVTCQHQNVETIVRWLASSGLSLPGMDPKKIVQEDEKAISSLLWKIVLHFHINDGEKPKDDSLTTYEVVRDWANETIKDPVYKAKSIADWKSGKPLFALITEISPTKEDKFFQLNLNEESAESLLSQCLEYAAKYLGIPKIVEASEFINPDEISIGMYLSFLRKYEKTGKEIRGPSFIAKLELGSDIYDSFPYRSRIERSRLKASEFFGICNVVDASNKLKKYVSGSVENWGYVLILYGQSNKKRKLMVCTGKQKTYIVKLRDLANCPVMKKKKQIRIQKSDGEFLVLQFENDNSLKILKRYCDLALSLKEERKIVSPSPKIKGKGTNRAIQKTYYLKGKISSTGIYSKSPVYSWSKKQVTRWFERIFYEDETRKVTSIHQILKEHNVLDPFLEKVFEKSNSGNNTITKIRELLVSIQCNLSHYLPKKKPTEETKKYLEKIGTRILVDLDVLEYLEVSSDPNDKFFSKPYRHVFDKLIEQRSETTRLIDIEKRLRLEKPWTWDIDEFRDSMITRLLYSYPLYSTDAEEKDVITVFLELFYKFVKLKLQKNEEIEGEGEDEEEEEESEEKEKDEMKKKKIEGEKMVEFLMDLDPSKFIEFDKQFINHCGFDLKKISYRYFLIFQLNKLKGKVKDAKKIIGTLEHENKVITELKIMELENILSSGYSLNPDEDKETIKKFKKKVKENETIVELKKVELEEFKKLLSFKKMGLNRQELEEKMEEDENQFFLDADNLRKWKFIRSIERRKEIEKMNRRRIKQIQEGLQREGKDQVLTFPVKLFLERRKPKVDPEWKNKIMQEIDPMISPDRYKFGYVHSFFHFPGFLELSWTPNSLVRLKPLDVSGGYIPIVGIEIPCILLCTYEEIKRRFEELGLMLMRWNTKRYYSTSGMSNKKKGKKSFDFVLEILEIFDLVLNPYMKKYVDTLVEMLDQGVSSKTCLKFLDVHDDFALEMEKVVKDYGMDVKTKRITFESHKKLDDFMKDVRENERNKRSVRVRKESNALVSNSIYCMEQQCLGFDNAFHYRYKMKSSEEDEEVSKPSEKGCPFFLVDDDS